MNKQWRKEVDELLRKIARSKGGVFRAYLEVRPESYRRLEQRAGCKLADLQAQKRLKLIEEGASRYRFNDISIMDVIADDARLTALYITIVKEMAVQCGIDAVAA
ncbi:hypothetical protein B7C51_15680 [Paenibacillus larvae subsp. pulvifaciens]|uniref:Uncharacterized protein n=1 Tax=Paenibacillus larvae subsp. pulvifaciens TaxID=1477 RepID=A0A1V0UVF7_9BACL|nr:hypothetical protein [Paenibacillus larvae]ARF68930.1 hypothetical protein B7C51_15680 [Paenibacillus larvae subsp. pulvifaciens]